MMIKPDAGAFAFDVDEPQDVLVQIIRETGCSSEIDSGNWRIEQSSDPLKQWLQFNSESVVLSPQGWKLHISASVSSAGTVLRRVLPILLTRAACFKMAASLKRLSFLNQGGAGKSQIGKFITVYPRNDHEAVELARLLDEATAGLHGPNIPSDRALHPGSLVYYRYGAFSGKLIIQNNIGLMVPIINTPRQEIEPDQRHVPYQPPAWAVDPFIRAGVAVEPPPFQRLLNRRYVLVAVIARSMNSTIYLGSDLEVARTCVIKGPGFAHTTNASSNRVEHEASILRQLAPDPHIPQLFDVLEQDGSAYLVIEDLEGETLNICTSRRLARGQHLSAEQVIAWARELAGVLEMIHQKGLVYADLKPSNVILGPDGQLHLIDFELTRPAGDTRARWKGSGTRGYMSPQQDSGQAVTISDDVYSFGALLYSLVTGAEPSYAPDALALLDRRVEQLRPEVGEHLKAVIVRCLARDARERYSSMAEVSAALEQARRQDISCAVPFGGEAHAEDAPARYRELARRLLDTLCATALQPKKAQGLAWQSAHPISYGYLARDVNTGNGGVILALAELVEAFGDEHERGKEVLSEGARWLSTAPGGLSRPLPGLYVGEAGVGAALLRTGQVLRNSAWIAAAEERARLVASLPYGSPDLFNGTAGRLRFHLLLWDETQEPEHLQAAIKCGEHLLATAIHNQDQEVSWVIPPDYDSLSGQIFTGYAHGAAGIADALLDLAEVTGDERFLRTVRGAGAWLERLAVPVLGDESGLNWPGVEGGAVGNAFWCHGAAGIGRFFLHAATSGVIPQGLHLAARAARTVARGTRAAGPTQCHGLAGNIEFLLDMYQASKDRAYLNEAGTLARLLEAFGRENDGKLVFSSELPNVFTPDYMVGYAGVALCLLRLSLPGQLPHQLSRAGFRYRG